MARVVTPNAVYTYISDVDPTVSESECWQGSLWINSTTKANFYCADPTFGAQIWTPLSSPVVPFTPLIIGSTSAGKGTYTIQQGYYILTGSQIVLSSTVTWTAHTGTGNMTFSGFPKKIRNLPNYQPVGSLLTENINLQGNFSGIIAEGEAGTTIIDFYGIKTNSGKSAIPMSTSGTIHLTLGYIQ